MAGTRIRLIKIDIECVAQSIRWVQLNGSAIEEKEATFRCVVA